MSWSRAEPGDWSASLQDTVKSACLIVEPGLELPSVKTIVRIAARRHRATRVFRSAHRKRLVRNGERSCGVIGGLVVVVDSSLVRVVAILKPSVITVKTADGWRVVVARDTLPQIAAKDIQKVEANSPRLSCRYNYDVEKCIRLAASDNLSVWAKPVRGKVFVGLYQSRRTLKLGCIGCGQPFDGFPEWEKHTGEKARGLLKGDPRTGTLVSKWLTCDAQPPWDGMWKLDPQKLDHALRHHRPRKRATRM